MGKGMTIEEEKLYNTAMEKIDDLVQEVFERCDEVAKENHFEQEWVLGRFRERFNRKKREWE